MPRRSRPGGWLPAEAIFAVMLAAVIAAPACSQGVRPPEAVPSPSPTSTSPRTPEETRVPTEEPSPPPRPSPDQPPANPPQPPATRAPVPAPQIVTHDDSGETLSLALGREVRLRLDNAWLWNEPVVEGTAVGLVPVDYLVDPGYREWIVSGERTGRALVSARGEPNCADPQACPPTSVRLTLVVA